MTELELLAPARNEECAIAAIDHGADAVYIGADRFGARQQAGNSTEVIERVCRYAHQFGAKVYVTLNTIVYDEELQATAELAEQVWRAGADAILVQDMGLLRMPLPDIALHASTQTDNRSADKVRWLRDMGFSRVVLARELTVEEIADIHRQVPDVELEVFVHGALCVSYSGLCYISEHCFRRSANRGACAQFCRMPFDLVDADGTLWQRQRHLLSLKDLCQADHIEELVEAGACSLKIEGRLKDASYVKNVVAAYSQRLDETVARHPGKYRRVSRGTVRRTFTPDLHKTFSRGFTTYFLHGRQPDIFSPDTPKAIGEPVGTVKEIRRDSFNVAGTSTFSNGDGLCFVNSDNRLEGFRVNKAVGNRLFPQQMPKSLLPGTPLYRNTDREYERLLEKSGGGRRIAVRLTLGVTADGYSLTSGGHTVTTSCAHQPAERDQRENIRRQLSRLGDTIFEAEDVEIADDFHYFIPNSLLSELRRALVGKLLAAASQPRGAATLTTGSKMSKTAGENVARPYAAEYMYNIANSEAAAFYNTAGPTAYELTHHAAGPLMQCRHCIRYSLGYCRKHGGRQAPWHEPVFLRLSDGRRFRLEFDCRHCQMNVYSDEQKKQ